MNEDFDAELANRFSKAVNTELNATGPQSMTDDDAWDIIVAVRRAGIKVELASKK